MDHFCYLCFVFVMLSCLFNAALWSSAGKELTSWLLCVIFYCIFVTFPCGVLGQVWYLIVSIPDLCLLTYFNIYNGVGFALLILSHFSLISDETEITWSH